MQPDQTADYKRPESVLVVVYSRDRQMLLLERCQPVGFWQSVTGSMAWQEHEPRQTACRELYEETGIQATGLCDCQKQYRYPILPQWRHRYQPGTAENTEHLFALELAEPYPINLNPREHRAYRWLEPATAAELASSWSNRDAILHLDQYCRSQTRPNDGS